MGNLEHFYSFPYKVISINGEWGLSVSEIILPTQTTLYMFHYRELATTVETAKRGTSGPEVGRLVLREIVSYVFCVFLRNTCTVHITGYNSKLTLSLCLSDKQLRMYKHSYTVSEHT